MCKISNKLLLYIVAGLLLISSSLFAKPMRSPSLSEAVKSEWIVVATYEDYKKESSPVEYFDGVTARYKVVKVLKNANIEKEIEIRYVFQDGSACTSPEGWRFDEKLMPKSKTKWILFLSKHSIDEPYVSYRGDFGRIKFTRSKISKIQNIINKKMIDSRLVI